MNKLTSKLYAVILAGGSGTRFWPFSRKSRPKQFLDIAGKESLLKETLRRVNSKVSPGRIFIAAGAAHHKKIKKQIASFRIPPGNYLLEPSGKNTAPAIFWAAGRIHALDKDAVITVLPSDHLIENREGFLKVLDRAVKLAEKDYLVTLGIVPTRPETGYGYLKTKRLKGVLRVEKFTEKPSRKKAEMFLKGKRYLWNSGMFVWKASVILEEFKRYQPKIYGLLGKKHSSAEVRKAWKKLPSISVDYAILEKSKRVAAVPAKSIGWSDLGSWEALFEVLKKDAKRNVLRGNIFSSDCKDTLIWAGKRTVAAVGLNNLVIVDTPDALLVCRKDLSQKIRDVIAYLKKNRKTSLL